MKAVRLLPSDWSEDILHDVTARFGYSIQSCREANPEGWIFRTLQRRALDVWRKENYIRSNTAGGNRRKEFVSMEEVQHLLRKDDTDGHSREWAPLVLRALQRDDSLSEADLEQIAGHCVECGECFSILQHQEKLHCKPGLEYHILMRVLAIVAKLQKKSATQRGSAADKPPKAA